MDGEVVSTGAITEIKISRFNRRLQVLHPERKLDPMLDACRVSDFVMFVLSGTVESDDIGETMIRAITAQGVSSAVAIVDGMEGYTLKQVGQVNKSLLSYFNHFFPAEESKLYATHLNADLASLGRMLCASTPRGVRWRDDRSYMLVNNAVWNGNGQLEIQGVVRGMALQANRLLHLPGYGDFQVEKITITGHLEAEVRPTAEQEDTHTLADVELINGDEDVVGDENVNPTVVRIDDHYYFAQDEDEDDDIPLRKKVPKGTSAYQAAWFVEDSDVDGMTDSDESLIDNPLLTKNGDKDSENDEMEDLDNDDAMSTAYTETTATEMFVDMDSDDEEREMARIRRAKRNDKQDDIEYPDEFELDPKESASERLLRYRALKSFLSSPWDPKETDHHTPTEWSRLARFNQLRNTRKKAKLQMLNGGDSSVQPGKEVNVVLRGFSADSYPMYAKQTYKTAFSLMQHEQKFTVLHFSLNPNSEYPDSIKSKEPLVLQCGPRRLSINPIFSQPAPNLSSNGIQKMEKYMHPGRPCMATIMGPVTFGNNLPVLLFKESANSYDPLELIATGSFEDTNSNRVLVKRKVLTGYPIKVNKKKVTIRYMFFNPSDVRFYKAAPLTTKSGKLGHITQSLGTHGYFKARFDGPVNVQDTVCMKLYKRVWPRLSSNWRR